MRERGGLGTLTPFSFLAKLSSTICCKQSTDQWSLIPSKGSVSHNESHICNPLLLHGGGCSQYEHFPTAPKSSISTFYPPSSLPLKEEELLRLSPDTQLLARVVPHSAHLPHCRWPGCLVPPERSIRTQFLTGFAGSQPAQEGWVEWSQDLTQGIAGGSGRRNIPLVLANRWWMGIHHGNAC